MLVSLALIFLCGMSLGHIMAKLHLPSLLGMLISGIVLGPFVLDLLDPSILGISAELRQIALIIILLRAGMNLDFADLIKVGRPAALMSFIPATFEMAAYTLLAPLLLGISYLEAAIMGAVLAAVSPAVVVPRMLNLIEEGYGKTKPIPQLIMTGASVDDVYVVVLFTAFMGLARGQAINVSRFLEIPLAIVSAAAVGFLLASALTWFFKKMHMRDTSKVLILLGISFLLVSSETWLKGTVPFSGLLAVMTMGIVLAKRYSKLTGRISGKFSKLWVAAELMLFVLVGASVDIQFAFKAGPSVILLVLACLSFRVLGVWLSLIGTHFTRAEKIFCLFAYLPKATVQAAIGAVPLAMGIGAGEIILTVAVVAILITAPLGAVLIDLSYRKLLTAAVDSSV